MKNFGTLFKFELKKALRKKAFWIALLAMLAIVAANELTPLFLGNYPKDMQVERRVSGTTIDEDFLKTVAATDPNDYKKFGRIETFLKLTTYEIDFSEVTEKGVYGSRTKINERMMDELHLSEGDRQYWRDSDAKNPTPYTYYYSGMYQAFFEICGYMNFMILILCVVGMSGMFADEKSRGTDQIIFSTRLGKRQLFGAKLLVGTLIGVCATALLLLEELVLCIVLYGTDGAQTLIQLFIPPCLMHITMGQAVLVMALLMLGEGLLLSLLAMMLSVLTMNTASTMALMVLFMFASMFNLPEGLGILSKLWNLSPATCVGSWLFDEYRLFHLFGLRLTIIQTAPIVWAVLALALATMAAAAYRRYEVKAR